MEKEKIQILEDYLNIWIKAINKEGKEKNEKMEIKGFLGKGAYGLVAEVSFKKDIYAAKIFKKEKVDENKLILEFRGSNIISVNQINIKDFINKKTKQKEKYYLVLMEKADLKDILYLTWEIYYNNKLKLIVSSPFEGETSDNFIRYFCYEFIKALELLDRKDYCHFDIKPNNILLTNKFIPKLSDFSYLRDINKIQDEEGKIEIPGGTHGYTSPEYYYNKSIPAEHGKKQDFFAIGSTIFKLKYGEDMIPHQRYESNEITADYMIDLIQRAKDLIQSKKRCDKDFIKFLCSLIDYKPEDRPEFEEIYRDKWLNKNLDDIKKCYDANFLDVDKLFIELNKSDFINSKKKQMKKGRKRFNFDRKKYA